MKKHHGERYSKFYTASSGNHALDVLVCHSSDKSHAISTVEEAERRQEEEAENEKMMTLEI